MEKQWALSYALLNGIRLQESVVILQIKKIMFNSVEKHEMNEMICYCYWISNWWKQKWTQTKLIIVISSSFSIRFKHMEI